MDRWCWYIPGTAESDTPSCRNFSGVSLLDGDQKTDYSNGTVILYPTKMVWIDRQDQNYQLYLNLSLVKSAEKKGKSLFHRAKIIMHLLPTPEDEREKGPYARSSENFVSLAFEEQGYEDFFDFLQKNLRDRAWEKRRSGGPTASTAPAHVGPRRGIAGIMQQREENYARNTGDIQKAFEDLKKLMGMAKTMVDLSNSIQKKLQTHQSDINEDDTIKFKSYLLSLGVNDPVTRESYGTSDRYYSELSRELCHILREPVRKSGGMMSLTDAYCRVNRARGLELISPEDLVNACRKFETLVLPLRLHKFDSGVLVVLLAETSLDKQISETVTLVTEHTSLTAEELSQLLGIPVLLAKER